ncbi:hypothetical protein BX661DRAFT_39703 [Kickxella alabastrina]|uniref:uncharacterized protein n=1 Tax=Kickxella alabastrina TaxID=61397 RepID=UPI002220203F|nr:uncharacterized protein BX661DRAFT_39703 [Kickxella alabastrina]KAI7825561.1 hypothetical protein BX661DRAFT_39703 [Kickxella alabastrina]
MAGHPARMSRHPQFPLIRMGIAMGRPAIAWMAGHHSLAYLAKIAAQSRPGCSRPVTLLRRWTPQHRVMGTFQTMQRSQITSSNSHSSLHSRHSGAIRFCARNAGQGGFITPNTSFVPAAAALLAGSRGPSFDMGYGGSGAIESSGAPPAAHVHSGYSGQHGAAQSSGSVAVANHGYGSADSGAGAGNTNGDDDEDMFGFSKGKKQVSAASAQSAQTTQVHPRSALKPPAARCPLLGHQPMPRAKRRREG